MQSLIKTTDLSKIHCRMFGKIMQKMYTNLFHVCSTGHKGPFCCCLILLHMTMYAFIIVSNRTKLLRQGWQSASKIVPDQSVIEEQADQELFVNYSALRI